VATNKEILQEVLSLKALHEAGLQKATMLIEKITGGVSTPPKNLKKNNSIIVQQRNIFIHSKKLNNANS
jgi:hypothetical protein